MAKVLNTSVRPYNLAVNFVDGNKIVRQKAYHFIPGKKTEVDTLDLEALKKTKGFKRYCKAGHLEILKEGSVDADEIKISKAARTLAEENGIDLTTIEPNNKNAISVDMVRELIEDADDADSILD